ncbi:MAG TPA: FHA domain-containing protein, partial [Kofleriaceae bacterium]|nr:FHA domain-containing protein [Kofleriaceae bacterium]
MPAADGEGERRPHLLVFCRGMTMTLHLEEGCTRVIGRSADADLTVPDHLVSRRHLEVRMRDGRVTIADLASANGTRLNGARVDASAQLAPGDVVSIGVTQISMQLAARATRPGPILDADALAQRLEAEIERSIRYGRPLTLLVVDGAAEAELAGELAVGLRGMDQLGRRAGGGLAAVLPEL